MYIYTYVYIPLTPIPGASLLAYTSPCKEAALYIYVYIYVYTYIHTYIYMYIHIYRSPPLGLHISMQRSGSIYICIYICIYVHTYIYIYICIYIYIGAPLLAYTSPCKEAALSVGKICGDACASVLLSQAKFDLQPEESYSTPHMIG
jgi:hypothetical protein